MFFDIGADKLRWLHVVIRFAVLNIILVVLTMVPGWFIATNYKSEIINYFSFMFNSIEQTAHSIDGLKKEILSFNKMKFIENNKSEKSNFIVYLQDNTGSKIYDNKVDIIFLNDSQIEKIIISKKSKLDPNVTINILTNSKTILNSIIPKYCHPFYVFKLEQKFNPFLIAKPRVSFLFFLSIFSAILVALGTAIKTGFFYKEKNMMHVKEFDLAQNFNSAQLNIFSMIIENIHEDLNYIFNYSSLETNDSKITNEKRMDEIRQSLGRIIIFRTRRRECSEIKLIEEINMVLDCCLDQISKKNIEIIKNNFCDKIYVHQTRLKNLLILFSITYHFIVNLPPRGHLIIDIEKENANLIRVKFSDNMPLSWKSLDFSDGSFRGFDYLFLPYEKLMLACRDEEVLTDTGNNKTGNYFILEYKLNQSQQMTNVIKGNFG